MIFCDNDSGMPESDEKSSLSVAAIASQNINTSAAFASAASSDQIERASGPTISMYWTKLTCKLK